ncbi:Type III restriction enzyme, res subunit [Streptococcus equinus]|uniref:helicase-related protein n=1 Tax=Streptococcus equinus TaxID=1335 RepID=UPI0008CABE6B|nr:helicase-related protein [Streptococcus equinus]SEK77362.1 Type III restriction enzyme, res subunit [Streptococcus equinus]
MDRTKETSNLIKIYNQYKQGNMARGDFVKTVCNFFDLVKTDDLTPNELNLLLLLANEAGVPQYYDLLEKINRGLKNLDEDDCKLTTISSYLNDSSLVVNGQKLHKYQKEVLERFGSGNNRFVLTAPTSFGKTFLVYQIIKKKGYNNILLIFPTLSLLSENFLKLQDDASFQEYNFHTLSEITEESFGEKNIFIFTPERYLSFLDNNNFHFDFAFMDEIYKIDNDFIVDSEEVTENERDTAYRLALEYLCRNSIDILLVGPYINFSNSHRTSFNNFANKNNFELLEYNDIEIVSKNVTKLDRNKFTLGTDTYQLEPGTNSNYAKISGIVTRITNQSENTLIYCKSKADVERYAKELLKDENYLSLTKEKSVRNELFDIFLNHIKDKFGEDWIVYRALTNRIGVHHSGIPKYIQKEIIDLFNQGVLLCLFSTTTITEGVNTSAKNIIISAVKKGKKDLKQFDAKNIAGRAGRFSHHYSGNVIDITKKFEDILAEEVDELEHKNYDKIVDKTDIDLQVTSDEFMTEVDKNRKEEIEKAKQGSGIGDEIFSSYKTISALDKIEMYSRISRMTNRDHISIKQLVNALRGSSGRNIHWEGMQAVLEIIYPLVTVEKLKRLIEYKSSNPNYSVLTVQIANYLEKGFLGTVNFYYNEQKKPKDQSVRNAADLIYTTFKYHLVKYLGTFDLLYRFYISKIYRKNFDDVVGIQLLLQKLEYNALTESARKLSDYGVPFSLVSYYDNETGEKTFDEYEQYIDNSIQKLLK